MIIYKTVNQVNGKFYVGKDAKNDPTYLGSGVLINRAIRKYGRKNFVKYVIESCENTEQLDERETFWIKELNATDRRIGYNIAEGGTGGDTSFGMSHSQKSEMLDRRSTSLKKTFCSAEYRARRAEISREIWSRPGHAEKIRAKMVGRKIMWAEKIQKSNKMWADTHSRRTHSVETRKKISESSKRTYVVVDEALENRIVALYAECGPRRMSERLASEGTSVSPYVIIRTLKKRGIYEKFRKMRPELKA